MLTLNETAIRELCDADKTTTTPLVKIHRIEAWITPKGIMQEEASDRDALDVFKGRYSDMEKSFTRTSLGAI